MTIPVYKLLYGLVKSRRFSKLQAKTLCVPDDMFEKYYRDSLKMSKQSLINITLSNGNYSLKSSVENTKSKVLIIIGENEIGVMRKSAQRLYEAIKASELYIAPAMRHGEMSLVHPKEYVELLKSFFTQD
jgi:threonyl-tRNA synthetase